MTFDYFQTYFPAFFLFGILFLAFFEIIYEKFIRKQFGDFIKLLICSLLALVSIMTAKLIYPSLPMSFITIWCLSYGFPAFGVFALNRGRSLPRFYVTISGSIGLILFCLNQIFIQKDPHWENMVSPLNFIVVMIVWVVITVPFYVFMKKRKLNAKKN
jgi:drug/metabolite transporter (DMT)-like permease